jgi:hypothetical protein
MQSPKTTDILQEKIFLYGKKVSSDFADQERFVLEIVETKQIIFKTYYVSTHLKTNAAVKNIYSMCSVVHSYPNSDIYEVDCTVHITAKALL